MLLAALACARPCPPAAPAGRRPRLEVGFWKPRPGWKARRVDRRGNLPWLPSRRVRDDMRRCGIRRIEAQVMLCMDREGRVVRASLLRSSRFPSWDRKLLEVLRTHRYRPYEHGGRRRAVCFPVRKAYHQAVP